MNFVVALLYGMAVCVLTGTGLAVMQEGLGPGNAGWSLALGALVALATLWQRRHCRISLTAPRGWEWVPVILAAAFVLRAFLWLAWWQGDELKILSPNNNGDLPLHLTFIEYFRQGAPFWPDSPILSGGKLAYAAGVDIFNAQLALAGVETIRGLVWVGLLGATLAMLALWRWGGAFTLMGFLCMGGLAGLAALDQGSASFFQDYPGQQKFDWAWKSLPLALLVTQRGFLFALPAGLVLLSSWRTRFFRAGDGWRISFLGEVLLYAAMPIFHLHTFLVLSCLLAVFFVVNAAARWRLTALVGAALIPATILVWFTTGMGQANPLPMWTNMADLDRPPSRPTSQLLGWQPGWMTMEPLEQPGADVWRRLSGGRAPWLEMHGRFVIFWIGNFGLWLVVTAWFIRELIRQVTRRKISAAWWWGGWGGLAIALPVVWHSELFQENSLTQLVFGRELSASGRYIFPLLVAASCVVLGVAIRERWPRRRWVRNLLWTIALLVLIDGMIVAAHQRWTAVPIIPASTLPLVLGTAGWLWLLRRMMRRWRPAWWSVAFAWTALWLFFVCCQVRFAPWSWDNTKLMLWTVVIVMPFLWSMVIASWSKGWRIAACVGLFFSGAVTLLGGLGGGSTGFTIAHRSQLDTVGTRVASLPRDEIIACAPVWNHPLLLNGRRAVIGYTGHLWSHGLQYQAQGRKLNTLMNGADEWRLAAAELGVRYLWWGPEEDRYWPKSRQSWRHAVQLLARTEWGDLYDLDLPRVPLEELD